METLEDKEDLKEWNGSQVSSVLRLVLFPLRSLIFSITVMYRMYWILLNEIVENLYVYTLCNLYSTDVPVCIPDNV